MPKNVKFKIQMELDIDPVEETTENIKYRLYTDIRKFFNGGCMSGKFTATVDNYSYSVKQVRKPKKLNKDTLQ